MVVEFKVWFCILEVRCARDDCYVDRSNKNYSDNQTDYLQRKADSFGSQRDCQESTADYLNSKTDSVEIQTDFLNMKIEYLL